MRFLGGILDFLAQLIRGLFGRTSGLLRDPPGDGPDMTSPRGKGVGPGVDAPPRARPTVHPVIRQMHQRALVEIFDVLGLTVVPGALWRILEEKSSPHEAVLAFARAVGCDPIAIINRDRFALDRMQRAIDLLISLDAIRSSFSPKQIEAIEALLLGGSSTDIERLQSVAAGFSSIFAARERVAALISFASYGAFLGEVDRLLAVPADATVAEVSAAVALSDRFTASIEKFGQAATQRDEIIGVVGPELASRPSRDPERVKFDAILSLFSTTEQQLRDDPRLSIDVVETLAADAEMFLEALVELACGLSGADWDPGTSDPGLDPLDEALLYFDFRAGARPDFSDIKSAWKKKARAVHPDTGGPYTPDVTARRTEEFKQCQKYYDRLRDQFEPARS